MTDTHDLAGRLLGAARRPRGQLDLQLGEARIGGRDHQEDQDHEQHVDQRDQVDLRLFAPLAGTEMRYGVRPLGGSGPPLRQDRVEERTWRGIPARPRSRPRGGRKRRKISAGIATIRPKAVLCSATEMPCASCSGVGAGAALAAEDLDHADHGAEQAHQRGHRGNRAERVQVALQLVRHAAAGLPRRRPWRHRASMRLQHPRGAARRPARGPAGNSARDCSPPPAWPGVAGRPPGPPHSSRAGSTLLRLR